MEDRLWPQVNKDGPVITSRPDLGPCWLWTGKTQVQGYAQMNQKKVHRVVYELLVGRIPDGLTLDHLCHTLHPTCMGGNECAHRRCLNPLHLEPVTHEENTSRGARGKMTHCKRGGHSLLDPANLKPTKGPRQCRACANEAQLRYMQRQREQVVAGSDP